MSFYSPIDRLAQNLPRPKGTGAEFMTELSKMPGYKAQEAEDRGLQALMNLPKMERAQFLEIMRLAKPAVVPKARDTQEEHHEEYTLPGGTNYREILLQHPNPKAKFQGVNAHFGGAPNILASVRAKDRTGPNGEKILHIEELQSDWHQQGREKGYASPETADRIKAAERAHRELKQQLEEAKDASSRFEQYLKDPSPVWQNPAAQERVKNSLMEENNKVMELMPQVMKAEAAHQDLLHQSRVPDAPFKKNWHEMALKKMIHHAAENGYDSIAITPGAEQADRYGLAQHIGVLSYDPERQHFAAFKPNRETAMHEHGATPERVSQLVGKELAQKLMASPRQGGFHYLEGDDIKVGGEGMKGFYDKIVPNFLNQFGKKYGAKVGTVPIESGEEMIPDNAGLGQIRSGKPSIVKLHHFPITPEMREDVTKNGVPLYAKGGEVEVKPTSYDPNLQRRHPELEAAIRGIAAGTTTHKQLDKLIAKHKPIKPYEFVPKPATLEDAQRGLNKNQIKAWRAHEDWPEGTPIGGRLDINAYEHHGVWANSIHDESGEKRPTSYGPVISIKNVTFDPNPGKSEEVGTGEKRKSPFARIKGELHHMTEDEAVQHMVDNLHHPDYAQVGYDPRRHGHFYDRKTLQPVTHSPHVVQIGPLALAHKPTYGKRETYAKGGGVSRETHNSFVKHKQGEKVGGYHVGEKINNYGSYESSGISKVLPGIHKVPMSVFETTHPNDLFYAKNDHDRVRHLAEQIKQNKYLDPLLVAMDEKGPYVLEGGHRLGAAHLLGMKEIPAMIGYEPEVEHLASKAKGGSIKPVGYTKERVTVSPSLDAMRYEMESVKHYTKKVK